VLSRFDRVAHLYDATRSLDPLVMSEVIDGTMAYLGKSSVVDFGVGTGRFAAPFVHSGLEVVGIDISPPMIKQARLKGVTGLALASAEATPFRSKSFDYAIVVHFMHLVQDWRAAIREISRVVRRGLVTVLEDPEGPHTRDLYLRLREKRGFKMAGLKRGEREMIEMVKPASTKKLTQYRDEFDPSLLLEEYAAKLHSVTWDIPDDVNSQIVEEMKPMLGRRRQLERSVVLAIWERGQLREFDPSA